MRQSLEEQSERYTRSLLASMASMAQCMVMCSIREKEAEIAEVCNRNVELQNLVKQLSFESQVWRNVACRDEATIESLKSHLTQISIEAESKKRRVSTEEGSGENHNVKGTESQCIHNVIGRDKWEENDEMTKTLKEHSLEGANMRDERNYCRICRINSVCILLLVSTFVCVKSVILYKWNALSVEKPREVLYRYTWNRMNIRFRHNEEQKSIHIYIHIYKK